MGSERASRFVSRSWGLTVTSRTYPTLTRARQALESERVDISAISLQNTRIPRSAGRGSGYTSPPLPFTGRPSSGATTLQLGGPESESRRPSGPVYIKVVGAMHPPPGVRWGAQAGPGGGPGFRAAEVRNIAEGAQGRAVRGVGRVSCREPRRWESEEGRR